MKKYWFYMFTIIAVIVLCLLIPMQAKGQSEYDPAENREYYEQLEDAYTQKIQQFLSGKGYRNAGITMTKVYQEDGSREYMVLIHHKRIDRLENIKKSCLLKELETVSFGSDQCRVRYGFLDGEGEIG